MVLKQWSGIISGAAQGGNDVFIQSDLRLKGGKNFVKLISVEFIIDNPVVAGEYVQFQITTASKSAIGGITDNTVKWRRDYRLPAGSLQETDHWFFTIRVPKFMAEALYVGFDCDNNSNDTVQYRLIADVSPAHY